MARIENDRLFLSQLKRHEGFSLEAYLCPAGALTIGWGHNCATHPVPGVEKVGDVISIGSAEILLFQDTKAIARELDDKIPWWRELSDPRAAVILNMAFNLGVPKLLGFKRALAAAKENDWNKAAFEMADSRWAEQVKHRSRELITQFALGAWQEA